MTNNDILRRLRYIFDLDDNKMIDIFAQAEHKVSRTDVCDWLKDEEDSAFKKCSDTQLAIFLNGFINKKRGKRDGPQIEPEKRLTYNLVFNKLKIALNLKAEDVLDIFQQVDFRLSKHELSAFFRKPGHRQYRECQTQVLRNFLKGLQHKHRSEH